MSRETLNIGSCPVDEPCVEVSREVAYRNAMRQECRLFRAAMQRRHGLAEDRGVTLALSERPHDFGPYIDMDAVYDEHNDDAAAYASLLEGECLQTWAEAGLSVHHGIVNAVAELHARDTRRFSFTMQCVIGTLQAVVVDVDGMGGPTSFTARLQADNTPVPISGPVGAQIVEESEKRLNVVTAVIESLGGITAPPAAARPFELKLAS